MKIKDLKSILDIEKVNPLYYYINSNRYGSVEVVVHINDLHNGKYEVYYTERDELQEKRVFDNENDACLYFLAYFIDSDHVGLCKYFKKGKDYDVYPYRQGLIDEYGSEEEGMA